MENENIEQALLQGRRLNFFMVGNDIADTEELNIYEKAICYQIARYSNNGNVAFPSYNTLAKKCGMSRDKAIKTVKALVEKGILLKVIRKGNSTYEKDVKNLNQSNLYVLNDNLHKLLSYEEEQGSSCEIPPYDKGSSCEIPQVVVENYPINNNNINIYGGVETSTEHNIVKTSSEKSDAESKQTKQKKSKKDKVIVVKEDTTYFRVMEHFNSKDNTKFKANTKEYIENIDALLITYSEEEIKGVIDYVRECNYTEKYWRPTTIFRPSNFERSYEFYLKWDKKKTCENTQASSQQQLFYFVNKNVGKVIASPIRPNLPNHLIFSSREEAEATLL